MSLCKAPWLGMYATGYGEYAPCCVATKHVLDMTPEEYWNSAELADIREKLELGLWPEDCGYCERKSERGLKHDAQRWNRYYEQNPVDTPTLLYLDYRPSNTCNLKCRMCVPNSSSLINSEAREYMDEYRGFRKHRTLVARDFDEFLQLLKNNDLEEIKVLGGEPTMDPMAIQALEAVQCKHLKITTNATNLNRKFRRILEKFETIHMVFSLDATQDTYEYIRTNANWRKVSDRIVQMFEERVATSYGFNVVCQPYNIFNLPELEAWVNTMPGEFEVNWDDSDVEYTSLSAVLPEHIEWCLQHVQDPNLRKLLQATEFDSGNHRKFCEYAAMLDEVRRTQLIDLDERFKQYV
jgi:MoaA/NifB/PqqE/SkfB family radical SAM enzyme